MGCHCHGIWLVYRLVVNQLASSMTFLLVPCLTLIAPSSETINIFSIAAKMIFKNVSKIYATLLIKFS